MIYYLTHIRDVVGNNYLGINIPNGIADSFLNELKDIIGEDEFKTYTKNQQERDHGSHHITVINVMDYNRLSKEMGVDKFINSLDKAFKYPIDDLKMVGVGTATKNENRAYFIVCESDKLTALRNRYNLPKIDFHSTLGFKWKDIFGIPKNQVITKVDKFLKLLKIEHYKNENWNFVKNIGNFDLNKDLEILPIEINNTNMKLKTDGYYIIISLLDTGDLWIVSKYPIDRDLPRMSETEIAKILNKI